MSLKQKPQLMHAGALFGQGFRNLMGRPQLDELAILLREAVQNSWDARQRTLPNATVDFRIRSRFLDSDAEMCFRQVFDQSGSPEPSAANTLRQLLEQKQPIRVLELSDFGTQGLSGSTRPDVALQGLSSRFINFFFDYGRSHEGSGDGGTFGFGRSSLYRASRANIILVDSLVGEGDVLERRMMACRLGDGYEVVSGPDAGRYSGIHFWGSDASGPSQPASGQAAASLADRLCLPARAGTGSLGTTVMIPWPNEALVDGEQIAGLILHHLWPKMVPVRDVPPMIFGIEIDGRKYAVKDPTHTAEYGLAVKALRSARQRKKGPNMTGIVTKNPVRQTGFLALEAGATRQVPPSSTCTEEDEKSSENLSALNVVTLMRPTELVVKYLRVTGAEAAEFSWSAVFICDDEEGVRTAFAASEPPAHDDWVYQQLNNKSDLAMVRSTVHRLIPKHVHDMLGTSATSVVEQATDGTSLAGPSARFSALFFSGDGHGASEILTDGNSGIGRGRNSGLRASKPEPVRIEMTGGKRIARYRITLSGTPGVKIRVWLFPDVHAEGRLDEPPAGLILPHIIACEPDPWLGEYCDVLMERRKQSLDVLVAFEGEYAMSLRCTPGQVN